MLYEVITLLRANYKDVSYHTLLQTPDDKPQTVEFFVYEPAKDVEPVRLTRALVYLYVQPELVGMAAELKLVNESTPPRVRAGGEYTWRLGAGGVTDSAELQARDREFQAILPLRGKILNTWEVDSQEILASQERNNFV